MKAYHPYLAEHLYSVSMIICERNIYILSEKSNTHKAIVSEKITAWIQYFIENDFLTIDELTNQIMSILQLSWPEVFFLIIKIYTHTNLIFFLSLGYIKMFICLL